MRHTTRGALDAQEGIMTPCTFTIDDRIDILREGLEKKFFKYVVARKLEVGKCNVFKTS
jgi:hypothetical protein